MTIVMISSSYHGEREEFAQALARKTNWPVLNREALLERAREMGIKIGRLEVSVIKTPGLTERLAREKEIYLALVTATLCEKSRQGNLIYTGRAGHLLLPGVSHRLRVGLTIPQQVRIKKVAQALNLTPDKAESYLSRLDEDVNKWIRYVHRADDRDPKQFDVFFNMETMSLSNMVGMLCAMAQLPDFQPTPASTKRLNDLYLSSQAKLRLSMDERTLHADLQVQADNGILTVTYPPHQDGVSGQIPDVLADLDGCREIQCTMAETNILWVQERFEPESDNFQQIMRLAQRWGAAVELLRLVPPGEPAGDPGAQNVGADNGYGRPNCPADFDGGVEDDGPSTAVDDGGLNRIQEELVDLGRYGGRHAVCGGYDKILERVQGSGQYALVVVGDMFLSKGHSTRTRQTRELAMNIRDRLKAPVITADELKSRFLFGKRQAITLIGFLATMILIYGVVFLHQEEVFDFISGSVHERFKWLSSALVAVFVPAIAYIYGTVAELALKIINID
ncbi:MAG: cytidylate kinase family protein [Thermodesulfobacteriota bacterium]